MASSQKDFKDEEDEKEKHNKALADACTLYCIYGQLKSGERKSPPIIDLRVIKSTYNPDKNGVSFPKDPSLGKDLYTVANLLSEFDLSDPSKKLTGAATSIDNSLTLFFPLLNEHFEAQGGIRDSITFLDITPEFELDVKASAVEEKKVSPEDVKKNIVSFLEQQDKAFQMITKKSNFAFLGMISELNTKAENININEVMSFKDFDKFVELTIQEYCKKNTHLVLFKGNVPMSSEKFYELGEKPKNVFEYTLVGVKKLLKPMLAPRPSVG